MTISLEQALEGLASFVDSDMIPKMPNGIKKIGAVMSVEALRLKPEFIAKPYEGFFKMVGVAVWTNASSTVPLIVKLYSSGSAWTTDVIIPANTQKSTAFFLLKPSPTNYSMTVRLVSGSSSAVIYAAFTTMKFKGM